MSFALSPPMTLYSAPVTNLATSGARKMAAGETVGLNWFRRAPSPSSEVCVRYPLAPTF
jgi:hypothetical protein